MFSNGKKYSSSNNNMLIVPLTLKDACISNLVQGGSECADKLPKYSGCIAHQFDKHDELPFQGVNCLHSYMSEASECVRNITPAKSLGHKWSEDPCLCRKKRSEEMRGSDDGGNDGKITDDGRRR